MFCTNCGNQIDDNAKFCTKCGAPVSKTSSTPQPPSSKEEQSGSKPKGKRRIAVIAVVLVCLLALAGAGIVGYRIWRGGSQAEEDQRRETRRDEDSPEKLNDPENDTENDPENDPQNPEVSPEPSLEPYTGVRENIDIQIRQVDNSLFPTITFYASVNNMAGDVVEGLTMTDFAVQEIDIKGNVRSADISDVYRVVSDNSAHVSVNLVLDASGSMVSDNRMAQAKNAAIELLEQMDLSGGDQVEVISFNDYVYLEQDFTGQEDVLRNAINSISTYGMTALYDGLYAGLYQTYFEDGIKCVIGFTDGMENASSYSFDDVVNLAQNTGIPVFIIGIGDAYDEAALQNLAQLCSGKYYSAKVNNLQAILADIYVSIYQESQDYYVFRYTTTNQEDLNDFRHIVLTTSDYAKYEGTNTKDYVPQSDVSGAFSSSYMNKDYILSFSSDREVTDADLAGLSLAELRIARNEIYARHGRQFKDSMLNQWFYSKVWYLNIPIKYSPDYFDQNNPNALSKLESGNAQAILAYEQRLMEAQDIYPNASISLLSDYDLSLSKSVLKTALAQVQTYPETDIRNQNLVKIRQAIDKDDIKY